MKNSLKKVFTSLILALTLIVSSTIPAFAAENAPSENVDVQRANATTLPAGVNYTIFNSNTFTNNKYYGPYYVQGRWLNLNFGFRTADIDAGEGGIYLTVKIVDANTGVILASDIEETPTKGSTAYTEMTFDLGSFGRDVYIFMDASSRGVSNGHYRSATITNFVSYVFG